jgi:hypothetical protein
MNTLAMVKEKKGGGGIVERYRTVGRWGKKVEFR